MAEEGIKISEMEEKQSIEGSEFIPIVDGSSNKKVKTDKFLTKEVGDSTYQAKGEYVTNEDLEGKGYLTEVPEEYVTDSELSGKDYLTKTEASSTYQTKGNFVTNESLEGKGYLTKTEAGSTYQAKGDYLTEVPDEYVTDTELEGKGYLTSEVAGETYQPIGSYAESSQLSTKQDTLVSGTNIKTVNGQTLLGSGDLVLDAIPEAPKDGKFYCRKDGEWVEIPGAGA